MLVLVFILRLVISFAEEKNLLTATLVHFDYQLDI